ncbi:MAG TPA: response regulator transcription factor [Dehalococcoidia bacterium]|nr:response regulator transcription factor [Dehalococcoidia bacterium]
MSDRIRVILADDHTLLRKGLRALLSNESDIEVIAEAADGAEAVRACQRLKPDIVVMDLSMPVLDGLQATRQIHDLGLETRVLVLTMHNEEEYLLRVLEAGGAGYVLKQSADTELVHAIRAVHRGEAFLYPSGVRMLLQSYLHTAHNPEAGAEPRPALSEREQEVLRLTAEGFSNQEIGRQLYISPKTVDTYRQRIMEKLGLHHRSELVRYALNRGLLKADDETAAAGTSSI